MRDLDEYFAAARQRRAALTSEDLHALICSADAGRDFSVGPRRSTTTYLSSTQGIIMMLTLLAGAITGVAWLLTPGAQSPNAPGSPANSTPRVGVSIAGPSHAAPDAAAWAAPLRSGSAVPALRAPAVHGTAPTSEAGNGSPVAPTAISHIESRSVPTDMTPRASSLRRARGLRYDRDIPGVNTIELSTEELARIGVRVDSVGVWMTWRENGRRPFIWAVSKDGMVMPSDGRVLDGVEVPGISPALITDDLGMKRAILFDPTPEETRLNAELAAAARSGAGDSVIAALRSRLAEQERLRDGARDRAMRAGKMVAILVRNPYAVQRNPKGWRTDCVLWYDITPELLERLPERVRLRLLVETRLSDAGAESASGGMQQTVAPNAVDGVAGERPYLDALRGTNGTLAASAAFPNPARDRATVSFTLAGPRKVAVTLHDVAGHRVREVVPAADRAAGAHELEADLSGLSDGVYLVVISTDRGERTVTRLIIAH